jgi:hypothetical protein
LCAAEVVDSVAHILFTRGFHRKIDSYKLVKGRQMVGRGLHGSASSGPPSSRGSAQQNRALQ